MRKAHWLVTSALVAVVSACVTINVYFPAAAAEKAAAEFIEEVIGETPAPQAPAPKQDEAPKSKPLGRSVASSAAQHGCHTTRSARCASAGASRSSSAACGTATITAS